MSYKTIAAIVVYLLRYEDSIVVQTSLLPGNCQKSKTMMAWFAIVKAFLWMSVALLMAFGIASLTSSENIF